MSHGRLLLLLACVAGTGLFCRSTLRADFPPVEPIAIGNQPQFVFDLHVIDNVWALKYKAQSVDRRLHAPVKYEQNPVIADDGGYVCVVHDAEAGLYRMAYQTWADGEYAICYAESADGVAWTRPNIGRHVWQGSMENNVVLLGKKGRASSPFLVEAPEADRRGFRHVMLYHDRDGLHLIGTNNLRDFDWDSDTIICRLHSDTQNAIVYDPHARQYVMYCRAKHIYRTFQGDVRDTGESRRLARMTSPELWTEWTAEPQNILLADELDNRDNFSAIYGMPTREYAGVFFGFAWRFRFNDNIYTELVTSRDGARFERLPWRPQWIELGPEGAWDDAMVYGGYQWLDVGDEWWMYYTGWDGPHGIRERTAGIGLLKMRKEGFVSMRGPSGGGVLCTRRLLWPDGDLVVNADARQGRLKVRVSDERRKPLAGFDYDDCDEFTGNSVAHTVTWRGKSLSALAGQTIRLEFLLYDADLFTFRAQ